MKKHIKGAKYIAIFFHSFGGTYKKIGRMNFKLNEKHQFSYKGKTFILLYDKPIFEGKKNKIFFYFDYNTGRQIILRPPSKKMDLLAEFVDDICTKHATLDILKATKQRLSWKELLPYLIGFTGLGMFIGFLLCDVGIKNGWF